jgi:hypothetical protein
MATRLAALTASALANAITTRADAGAGAATLKIYSGSQPATADTAVTGTLLATFTLNDPSFGAASNGVITLAGTPKTVAASASGTAGYFRLEDSTGVDILDGSVGTSGAELNLNTTTITSGVNVTITSGTITVPLG